MSKQKITYKDSGVNIDAGNELVRRIKRRVRSTFNADVLTDIGLFGAFYRADFRPMKKPVLVSSVDGVGTKLMIAFLMNRHDTIGQDLVNHCVNDILVCGARPLFFLDYFASGRLNPKVGEAIISGFVKACQQNSCALIGGETAEMPGMYEENEYDLAGTIVGVVDQKKIITGKSIRKGDVLIGLPSTGLHTNGYSLARRVLLQKYSVNDYIDELGSTLGDTLLKVHRSYVRSVYPLFASDIIRGLSHITGGGIVGNTMRIIPRGCGVRIDWESWQRPAIFDMIQRLGNVPEEDMRRTFNLGIGLILIVRPTDLERVIRALRRKKERPLLIGEVARQASNLGRAK